MKKRILSIVLILALLPTMLWAQKREVARFEFEVGGAIALGSAELRDLDLKWDSNEPGYSLHAEFRYNFPRIPFDVGVRVGSSFFNRDLWDVFQDAEFKSINAMGVVDYNFFRKSAVSLFVGVGLGYAALDTSHLGDLTHQAPEIKEFIKDHSKGTFCMQPRLGVELLHRIRLTASYLYQGSASNHFDVSVGIVFGGGKR